MVDVFISYARADRAIVEHMADALTAAGFTVWWDRQLVGGSEFAEEIERQLDRAAAVVVCWSGTGSKSRWVRDEAATAADSGKLIAVSTDGTDPPIGFRQFHCVSMAGWQGEAGATPFEELCRAVRLRVNGENDPAVPATATARTTEPSAAQKAGIPWIAVTPIKVRGADPDLEDLAEDLTANVCNGLARFSYLRVAPEASANAGRQAGARYALEGSIRKAGQSIRLTVRLGNLAEGNQVWGGHFTRDFGSENLFDLLDDLTDHVVVAVADPYGALMRDLLAPIISMTDGELTPYEAFLSQFLMRLRADPADIPQIQEALERAVKEEPENADAWAGLGQIILEEQKHAYQGQSGSSDRALQAARQAVKLDPQNAYAQYILADVLFFRRDIDEALLAAERSLDLNPWDTDAMAMIAVFFNFSGDWQRGIPLSERAMALNPNHPGWYRIPKVYYLYSQGDDEGALGLIQKLHMPEYYPASMIHAMIHGQLGNRAEAETALKQLLALLPYEPSRLREFLLQPWFYSLPELQDRIVEGLQKAGLDIE